jgi:proteasome lid subunit RPN8/RPN11
VRILEHVLASIADHARRDAPNECCGLLIGTADLIDEAVAAPNVLADSTRYQLDPRAHIDANRRLRGTARAVVGAYHSHPRTPAVPSPRDIAEANYPDFVWLIVSLAGREPECRTYRIVGKDVTELPLAVEHP